jgi:hypothetical protein
MRPTETKGTPGCLGRSFTTMRGSIARLSRCIGGGPHGAGERKEKT